MPANETELLLAFAELTSKIEALLEKQDELVDAMSKLKEAVYNPDEGLYARLRDLEQKLSSLEEWKAASTKFTWIMVTSIVGLFLATLWRVIIPL
jgi:predicted nuclease with TOPRIM domain